MRRLVAAATVILLTPLVSASDFQVEVAVVSKASLTIQAEFHGTIEGGMFLADHRFGSPSKSAPIAVSSAQGDVTVLRSTLKVTTIGSMGTGELLRVQEWEPERLLQQRALYGDMVIELDDRYSVRLALAPSTEAAGRLALLHEFRLTASPLDANVALLDNRGPRAEGFDYDFWPRGTVLTVPNVSNAATISLAGVETFVENATLVLADGTRVSLGERLNETRSTPFADVAGGQLFFDYDYAVLRLKAGTAVFPPELSSVVVARSLTGTWHGAVEFVDANGTITISEQALTKRFGHLHIAGRFDGKLASRQDGVDATLQGMATYVGMDGETYQGKPPWVMPTEAIAGAAGLAALLILFKHSGWRLLAAIAARWRQDPLANAECAAIREAISTTPGIRLQALAKIRKLGRSTLRYYVARLESGGFVVLRSIGRDIALWPAGDVGAQMLGEARMAIAIAQPARRQLVEIFRMAGAPMDYYGYREFVRTTGGSALPKSSFAYHANALVLVEALEATRSGKRRVYAHRQPPMAINRPAEALSATVQ